MLAGCNGAGKSSIGGAALRASGAPYFNPDEAARSILNANARRGASIAQEQANAAAWTEGRRLLERAIRENLDFAFETTLGGKTMTELLLQAAREGHHVHIWFSGLTSVELHLDRVRRRVAQGGHDIPEAKVRERYVRGRANLIRLMPGVASLRVFDNSADADPSTGAQPSPALLVRMQRGRIVQPSALRSVLTSTPQWAKPIVSAALKLHMRDAGRPQ
ncbi:MAG TPA: zeta toxin family protein [Casimicrobiaceae bacterium]|nr:zeta toxin family protein [Casimicrobiaceae bacterium]